MSRSNRSWVLGLCTLSATVCFAADPPGVVKPPQGRKAEHHSVLSATTTHTASPALRAAGDSHAIIFVGGKSSINSQPVPPGKTSLNPQPIPPGISPIAPKPLQPVKPRPVGPLATDRAVPKMD